MPEDDHLLDMRYNSDICRVSARDVLSMCIFTLSDDGTIDEISTILRRYGEVFMSHEVACEIAESRKARLFRTVGDLKETVYGLPWLSTESAKFKLLILVFQALRIFVNGELDNIDKFVRSLSSLSPSKFETLCIFIGFHSLEHNAIKLSKSIWDPSLTKYVVKNKKPSTREIEENRASRSARLFAWNVSFKNKLESLEKTEKARKVDQMIKLSKSLH